MKGYPLSKMMKRWFLHNRYFVMVFLGIVMTVAYYFSLPRKLFDVPYSTLLESSEGRLLGAHIAEDGQWRFPAQEKAPEKFVTALLQFEDKRFYRHIGVDLMALVRAAKQNISSGSIISGGSTLSMQVIRLSRQQKKRTLWEKLIEIILATRLELRYSKAEILALYAAHAPFGGNVVGIEAATWRYFGRQGHTLSWAEAALLAVLPNSPALIHPGKNRTKLKKKRNRLLKSLWEEGKIDPLTYQLATQETLPEKPYPLPRYAPHLLDRSRKSGLGQKRVKSSIDFNLQGKVLQVANSHRNRLQANGIHNTAIIVAEVNSGKVLAYMGNVQWDNAQQHGHQVDVLTSPRSTGSILKPFLYAAMLSEGKIMPKSLVYDVPLFIRGFAPRNFYKTYDGAVPADAALARSLNIPAVNLLRQYRYEKFHSLLQKLGMKGLHESPDHYGLSLILGGAEGSLWDITGMYASLGRVLNRFNHTAGSKKYSPEDIHPLHFIPPTDQKASPEFTGSSYLSAGAIWETFHALLEVYRPAEENAWRLFESSKKIAWKTGTSFGYRDGWAVGLDAKHVVGVWVGNADGEGRPGLTGISAAAPLLFDVFDKLEGASWFRKPENDLRKTTVCRWSGFKNSKYCDQLDTLSTTIASLNSPTCPYHRLIHLDPSGQFRVNSGCEAVPKMVHRKWFVLPPAAAYYYRKKNASYRPLPPLRADCTSAEGKGSPVMESIYPKRGARIYIPMELDGQWGKAIFEVAHRDPNAKVFWHVDEQFQGMTHRTHRMGIQASKGQHTLTLVDQDGELLAQQFEVITDER